LPPPPRSRLTGLGKSASLLLVFGLAAAIVFGVSFARRGPKAPGDTAAPRGSGASVVTEGELGPPPAKLAELKEDVPKLDPPGTYRPKDNTVEIELSEYAGYSGLIAANGGLEPSENSVFFKDHGIKVKITLSEEESWSALNRGKMAASATTVDVLAVYGRQFDVVVPAQIGFSRGADGVVVRSDVRKINDLKGKILATSQFTEADFLIRYLAEEAGLGLTMLADFKTTPSPNDLNLIYCEDAFAAGDLFLGEVVSGRNRVAGCVTWAPKTTEVAEGSGGRARVLTTNRNLLMIADVLIVNKGFAQANPKMVAGLVDGLLKGNRMVRDTPDAHLDVLAKAFNANKGPDAGAGERWDRIKARSELAKVHLANLPENLAFFGGAAEASGATFKGIYEAAVKSYGPGLIPSPAPLDHFVDNSHLVALQQSGGFKDQKYAIAPIRTEASTTTVEQDPVLSKNIRFYFKPNLSELDMSNPQNLANLDSIRDLMRVSPGSTIVLRGHVDNGRVEEFRRNGEQVLRTMTAEANRLSQDRANEVLRRLAERNTTLDRSRLHAVGRGWEEPVAPPNSEENRRVEVQWFLVE
jgi:NitT/TauT family transport system substrate-binding protein